MPSNNYVLPAITSPIVEMDPTAPGTFIRRAMFIEGCLNIFGGVSMLMMPSTILSWMVSSPKGEITPTATALIQWLGALVLGLTQQLFLAIPNTRGAVESRPMVYYTLGAGELALIPLFVWQALGPEDASGITRRALMVAIGALVPPLLLRGYVLFVRPSLLGRYKDISKKTE